MIDKVDNFMQWMKSENFEISEKILIVNNPESNYGLVSIADIEVDEIIFKIPRKSLLSMENSALYIWLIQEDLAKKSKWACLILCIFHELFLGESSRWVSYLSLFPNFEHLQLPMFWSDDNEVVLKHAGMESLIEADNTAISEDFTELVLPFINKYPGFFKDNIDIEQYKYYVAFVMSYSFTEPNDVNDDAGEEEDDDDGNETDPVHYMVPMADILNHKSHNNAHLLFEKDQLVMMATKHIDKGEEILNTYGDLPNTQLLQMYGFTLSYDDNTDDVVELNLMDLHESEVSDNVLRRIKIIGNIASDLLLVVIGRNGFLNTEELALTLHTLHTDDAEFEERCEELTLGDRWAEEIEEVEMMADNLDSFESINQIPAKWRSILNKLICKAIKVKKEATEDVTKRIDSSLPCPALFVQRLLCSHVQLLENSLRVVTA